MEVCKNSNWTNVCDDDFGTSEANVACRQLGFSGTGMVHYHNQWHKHVNLCVFVGATTHCCAAFGEGVGEIFSDQLNCVGTESLLSDCPLSNRGSSCSHLEDVGVTCAGIFTFVLWYCTLDSYYGYQPVQLFYSVTSNKGATSL